MSRTRRMQRTTFNGLCQVLVQATGEAGEIILTASAAGLASAELEIASEPARRRPFVPVQAHFHLVTGWRRSPKFEGDSAPDPAGADYNPGTWEPVSPHDAFPELPLRRRGFRLQRRDQPPRRQKVPARLFARVRQRRGLSRRETGP
jgi:hypothetical protein